MKQREPVQLGIKIQVDAIAMQKLWTWVAMAKGEVSAIGTVNVIEEDEVTILRVTDFHLLKQTCTESETELDPSALAKLLTKVDPRKLRCWVHSHGDMAVFWSGTDDETIEGLSNGEWLLSLVVNKLHDTMMRLDQYYPAHLYLSDVVFELYHPVGNEIVEQWEEEFKKKVTENSDLLSAYLNNKDEDDFLWEDMYA